jgi:general stress protein CsbA
VTILKWFLVLPSAVGGYLAAWLAAILILLASCTCVPVDFLCITVNEMPGKTAFFMWLLDESPWVLQVFVGAVASYFFIIAGSTVAPSNKFPVAIALSVILILAIATMHFTIVRRELWIRFIDIASVMIICAIACKIQFDEHFSR